MLSSELEVSGKRRSSGGGRKKAAVIPKSMKEIVQEMCLLMEYIPLLLGLQSLPDTLVLQVMQFRMCIAYALRSQRWPCRLFMLTGQFSPCNSVD